MLSYVSAANERDPGGVRDPHPTEEGAPAALLSKAFLFIVGTMNRLFRTRFVFLIAAAFSISAQATDQPGASNRNATSGELFETIACMDSAIFDAFNAHDVELLMTMFTDDLEFYHDTGGLTNYRQSAESFRKMFAGTPDIRRDLVKGSLEVYPIKDHGAIEIGEHRFCHKENGKDDCGTFKFAMVWRQNGESWKISRVISYGH
jgi:ketosteroid isomerase-like protein